MGLHSASQVVKVKWGLIALVRHNFDLQPYTLPIRFSLTTKRLQSCCASFTQGGFFGLAQGVPGFAPVAVHPERLVGPG